MGKLVVACHWSAVYTRWSFISKLTDIGILRNSLILRIFLEKNSHNKKMSYKEELLNGYRHLKVLMTRLMQYLCGKREEFSVLVVNHQHGAIIC